jgi:hypothetical protein
MRMFRLGGYRFVRTRGLFGITCAKDASDVSSVSDCIGGGVFFRMGFLVGGSSPAASSASAVILPCSLSIGGGLPTLVTRKVEEYDTVLCGESRELEVGLNSPRSEDVPDDAEVGRPEILEAAAMGDTDLRFRGMTRLGAPLSESQSERLPAFDGLVKASDGDKDEMDDCESRCTDVPLPRNTSDHSRSDPMLLFEGRRLLDSGVVIKDEEFSSRGRGADFAARRGLAERVNEAKEARML